MLPRLIVGEKSADELEEERTIRAGEEITMRIRKKLSKILLQKIEENKELQKKVMQAELDLLHQNRAVG